MAASLDIPKRGYQQGRHQQRQRLQARTNPGPQLGPQPRQAARWIGVKFCAAVLMSAAPRNVCACACNANDPTSIAAVAAITNFFMRFLLECSRP